MAAPETVNEIPLDVSKDDRKSIWNLLKAPFRAVGYVAKLPFKAWEHLFDDVPLLGKAKWLLHPATLLAIGGGLAAGYHHNVFDNLNFSVGGRQIAAGDALNTAGQTVSLGAQNFYNWGRSMLPNWAPGSVPEMAGPYSRTGSQLQPWEMFPPANRS